MSQEEKKLKGLIKLTIDHYNAYRGEDDKNATLLMAQLDKFAQDNEIKDKKDIIRQIVNEFFRPGTTIDSSRHVDEVYKIFSSSKGGKRRSKRRQSGKSKRHSKRRYRRIQRSTRFRRGGNSS
jgi:hypothetical protein